MANRDIIAIGASAGGHRALQSLVSMLPADFSAALLVVVHLPASWPSVLPSLLNNAGPLPAGFARDGDLIRPGHIHIAPPDMHMLAADGHLLLRHGPTENRMRPAIDPLLRSVAVAFGGRGIGVLLTGMMSDGVAGLRAIQQCGGIAIVQDPNDAEFSDLPANALARIEADHVARVEQLGALLHRLVREPAGPSAEPPSDLILELAMATQEIHDFAAPEQLGGPTLLTCPDCHGALWEIKDGDLARYRCHVGHAYTIDALVEAQAWDLDRALSTALRALQERIELLRRLAEDSRRRGHDRAARQWEERTKEYEHQATLVRDALLRKSGAGAK